MAEDLAMTLIDLTQLCEPYRRLTLERSLGYWIVVGADGDTVYLRTPDVLTAVRFMRAFALRHSAELDEESITAGLVEQEARSWSLAQTLAYNRLVDELDPFSRRVADVIPIRKEQA
jgi:hypothetical protein